MDAQIAAHYNQKREQPRDNSQIAELRKFNNWIKTVLINLYVPKRSVVLDLCCGKGGDLFKFKHQQVRYYVGADVAGNSVRDALNRYHDIRGPVFQAKFFIADCHTDRLAHYFPSNWWFDTVSCQFALHYAFASEERLRGLLVNITDRLKRGGHFIATFPDAEAMLKKFITAGTNTFGDEFHLVTLVDDPANDPNNPFGHAIIFTLVDAVEECPEYLVDFPTLTKLAREYGLELVLKRDFYDLYFQYREQFADLLQRMFQNKAFKITKAQWDIAGLYTAVVFKRQ